jgi:hypothetical protein
MRPRNRGPLLDYSPSRHTHFVEPVVAVRDDGGLGRDAELKGLKHVANIGIRRGLLRRRPSDTKRSFLAGRDRSSGFILQRWFAAFGCRKAASKPIWRRTVTAQSLVPRTVPTSVQPTGAFGFIRVAALMPPVGGLAAS